ncbi:hypothetical protein [Kitasatospora viridis]|uniref:Uncharacterized protein n=1 Tax=Kitasatospora viridis TaxID=281105 RepID=A0A561T746_9ACTN|nr:hypothetical protein [Kitasatospora viridis]TWF82920.1 hypothetical protein FHX73_14402 [Kitasatospora viridis]
MDAWDEALAFARRRLAEARADAGFAATAQRRYRVWEMDREWAGQRIVPLLALVVHGSRESSGARRPTPHEVVTALRAGRHEELLDAAVSLSAAARRQLDPLAAVFRDTATGAGLLRLRLTAMALDVARRADGPFPAAGGGSMAAPPGPRRSGPARVELRLEGPGGPEGPSGATT